MEKREKLQKVLFLCYSITKTQFIDAKETKCLLGINCILLLLVVVVANR